MMTLRLVASRLATAAALLLAVRPAVAQCTNLPVTSPEAKLLAYYAVPLAFSGAMQPRQLRPWQMRFSLDITPMPAPDSATRATNCYSSNKQQTTNLASILPRPRLAVGLPYNLEAEVSWLPPVRVKDAKANMVGLALAWTRRVAVVAGSSLIAQVRAHTLLGSVEGPITCNVDVLQSTDPLRPCFGRLPSNDRLTPNVSGGELTLALDLGDYAFFAMGGMNSMTPEFQVDHVQGAGVGGAIPFRDRSLVTLNERLNRVTYGGGATWRIFRGMDLTGQIYGTREDVTVSRISFTFRPF